MKYYGGIVIILIVRFLCSQLIVSAGRLCVMEGERQAVKGVLISLAIKSRTESKSKLGCWCIFCMRLAHWAVSKLDCLSNVPINRSFGGNAFVCVSATLTLQ